MADDDDAPTAESSQAADQGLIVGEFPVAAQLDEIVDKAGDIVDEVRAFRVARDLRLLPGIEMGVGLSPPFGDAAAQRGDLGVERARTLGFGELRQLFELGLEIGDRAFEIQIVGGHRQVRLVARGVV